MQLNTEDLESQELEGGNDIDILQIEMFVI
jgi:hypothetical protein